MPLFPPPQPIDWIIGDYSAQLSGTSGTVTGNQVYLYAFEVRANELVSGVRLRIGATATGTTDAGIYDSGGNLLTHSGAVANTANTNQTFSFSSAYALSPGQYFLAVCLSNSTDTITRLSGQSANTPQGRFKTATNTATLGVLPPTTGGYSNGSVVVAMEAITVGGLA